MTARAGVRYHPRALEERTEFGFLRARNGIWTFPVRVKFRDCLIFADREPGRASKSYGPETSYGLETSRYIRASEL
jgi:hypothetical protein